MNKEVIQEKFEEKIEEKIEEKVEQKKKQAKKKVLRAVRRTVLTCVGGACLLCTGYFLGVHHRVIEAYLKGEPLPVPPKGSHCPIACLQAKR